jgi:predicted nucleic acid-binding protein
MVLEVMSALRGLFRAKRVDKHDMANLFRQLRDLPAERIEHTFFLERIWELRHNFTVYDAMYIALAETLEATLFTCDAKWKGGHRAQVHVFD